MSALDVFRSWGLKVIEKDGITKSFLFLNRGVVIVPTELTDEEWDYILCEFMWTLPEHPQRAK